MLQRVFRCQSHRQLLWDLLSYSCPINLTFLYRRAHINRQLQHCTCKYLRANFAEKRRNFGAFAVLVSARFRELGDGTKRKFAALWHENLYYKHEISFWLNELSFDWNYISFFRSDISSACNEILSLGKILSGPEKINYHLNVKVSAIIICFWKNRKDCYDIRNIQPIERLFKWILRKPVNILVAKTEVNEERKSILKMFRVSQI